jgi:hypothetical protein
MSTTPESESKSNSIWQFVKDNFITSVKHGVPSTIERVDEHEKTCDPRICQEYRRTKVRAAIASAAFLIMGIPTSDGKAEVSAVHDVWEQGGGDVSDDLKLAGITGWVVIIDGLMVLRGLSNATTAQIMFRRQEAQEALPTPQNPFL